MQLGSVAYAGSHGFEIDAPGQDADSPALGEAFLPDLDAAERELRDKLLKIDGHAVERKRFSIAVHYRRVADGDVARLEAIVDDVLSRHPRLRKGGGKKVFEVQPRVDWNKGRALEWLLEHLSLDGDAVTPIYVGDDLTDEDAFRALAGRGVAIAVGDQDRPTAADYRLASPEEVRRFLAFLERIVDGKEP